MSRLHLGFILAWIVIIISYLVLRRSALGCACGQSG